MQAKKSLKISLNRETLVNLDTQGLDVALGGLMRETKASCVGDCASLPATSCGC